MGDEGEVAPNVLAAEGPAAAACSAARTGVGSLKHTMEVNRDAQRCNDWR
jgi:hypothetical protein